MLDPDIIARGDVGELLNRDMQGKALVCRPRPDSREGFYTSVMLMDCSRLRHWNWRDQVEEVFRHERPLRPWLSLTTEDPSTIGDLEEEWNDFDRLNEKTRLLHYTNRRTQPWLTGLPYRGDFVRPNSAFRKVTSFLHLTGLHQSHPHEDLFLELLGKSLEHGEMTEDDIREQIRLGLLRPDALAQSCMARLKSRAQSLRNEGSDA